MLSKHIQNSYNFYIKANVESIRRIKKISTLRPKEWGGECILFQLVVCLPAP